MIYVCLEHKVRHGYEINKDENVHRFSLSEIIGKILERGREKDSFGILYTGYILSVTHYQRQPLKVNRQISRDLQMKI